MFLTSTQAAENSRKTEIKPELPFKDLQFNKSQSRDIVDVFRQFSIIGKMENNLLYESPDVLEVKEAVAFASQSTGVREDFLMGMLVVESDLGRNVGGCTFKEVESGALRAYRSGQLNWRAWRTFQKRKRTFVRIAGELDYDYRKLKVSCNPARYAGTGGAMGVGQFMPDTWREYQKRIARILGKKNPDPWSLRDGVVAMALKLSDVPGVTGHSVYAEKNAAKIYLSGGTSWRYNWYANRIQYWARNYEEVM